MNKIFLQEVCGCCWCIGITWGNDETFQRQVFPNTHNQEQTHQAGTQVLFHLQCRHRPRMGHNSGWLPWNDNHPTHHYCACRHAARHWQWLQKCIVGMNNHFAWAKVMKSLTEMGIGVMGTARHQCGWLPKSHKDIKDDRFNTMCAMNDVNKYEIVQWVDDNVANMVSNVHKGDKVVTLVHKKQRPTLTNWNHLNTV